MDLSKITEALQKVRGVTETPLTEATETVQEACDAKRAKWVPESIQDEDVSDFMGAVAQAHKAGKDSFSFGGKNYKVSMKKDTASAIHKNMQEEAYTGKNPHHIKSVGSSGQGMVTVVTNAGAKHTISAKDTGGKMPKPGEHINNYVKEEAELDEAFINGREYASHGLMHPDHAKREFHKVGTSVDYYQHKTGDKTSGKVVKNDGKEIHFKQDGTGKVHKFKISADLPKTQSESKYSELETMLSEGGLTQDEIEGIISKIEERAHVGLGGKEPAAPQEMGDNLSDDEMNFVDQHELQVVDRPDAEKQDPKAKPHAEEPKATPVDQKKVIDYPNRDKPEVAVKSQAAKPATK